MKSKQEVIQQHYIDLLNADKFSKLMPHIDENGWCITLDQMGERVSPPLKELGFTREQMDDLTDHCHIHGNLVWRPKTLQGIENNNGWTRIESEADLPQIAGYDFKRKYFTIVDGKIRDDVMFNVVFGEWRTVRGCKITKMNVTHYMDINIPPLPIF